MVHSYTAFVGLLELVPLKYVLILNWMFVTIGALSLLSVVSLSRDRWNVVAQLYLYQETGECVVCSNCSVVSALRNYDIHGL